MIIFPDGDIDISRCGELQDVLWSVTPEMRKKMDPKSIHAYYETGSKYIDISKMTIEEHEVFDNVIEKYGPLLA